jgi:hypothetical protein
MKSKRRMAYAATLFFVLSGAAIAQGSVTGNAEPYATDSASNAPAAGLKQKSHKAMKKVSPPSEKADADSVTNGGSGSDAKGGE